MPCALVVARLTFKEAVRRKIMIGAFLLGLVFLLVYGAGLYFINCEITRDGTIQNRLISTQMYNFLLLSGLYVVNFLFAAMTVLTSVDTIAGEIASGTIQTMTSKPVRRWEILLGKWLGYVTMLTIYLVLMAGGVAVLSAVLTGYWSPNLARGTALIWLNGLVLLNVSLLGGTQLSTLATGVVVFAGFGVAFIGGWVEQIGSFVDSTAAVNVGIFSSLLMPTEALWYAALYALAALVLAVWRFERRDL
jgi:ABC-type transport system involved in multi-copper enzyme maturation permease subunit